MIITQRSIVHMEYTCIWSIRSTPFNVKCYSTPLRVVRHVLTHNYVHNTTCLPFVYCYIMVFWKRGSIGKYFAFAIHHKSSNIIISRVQFTALSNKVHTWSLLLFARSMLFTLALGKDWRWWDLSSLFFGGVFTMPNLSSQKNQVG